MKANVYVALRRGKDNDKKLSSRCYKFVVKRDNEEEAKNRAIEFASNQEGIWRVYRTVNKRDLEKGRKELIKFLIDNPDTHIDCVDSRWKSILMQPKCKGERKFLVDIDTEAHDQRLIVGAHLASAGVNIHEKKKTPNGYHFVTDAFNPQILDRTDLPNVEVKKDALVYIASVIGNKPKLKVIKCSPESKLYDRDLKYVLASGSGNE